MSDPWTNEAALKSRYYHDQPLGDYFCAVVLLSLVLDTACLAQKMKLNCNQAIKMDSINPAGVVNIPERVWW